MAPAAIGNKPEVSLTKGSGKTINAKPSFTSVAFSRFPQILCSFCFFCYPVNSSDKIYVNTLELRSHAKKLVKKIATDYNLDLVSNLTYVPVIYASLRKLCVNEYLNAVLVSEAVEWRNLLRQVMYVQFVKQFFTYLSKILEIVATTVSKTFERLNLVLFATFFLCCSQKKFGCTFSKESHFLKL